jgi:serine/threonine protein kinase
MELTPDTMLHERYRIVRPLGQGGMGSVYLAYDTALEAEVAVKSNRSTSSHSSDQFLREARLLAALRHPNLPRVIDYFVVDQGQCLVMDYIPGDDLEALLRREGPQPLEKVMVWAGQLGSALSYLHSQNPAVIHRDIKPANLKLTDEGEVILVDFGIAKASDTGQATATGATGYTPGFAPPEQYGRAGTGPYTDQYAFAATLYTLLTGKRPAESVQRVLGQAVLTPIEALVTGVPIHIQTAIERAMALKPEDRFQSVEDMMRAMADASFVPTARIDPKTTASAATVFVPRVEPAQAVAIARPQTQTVESAPKAQGSTGESGLRSSQKKSHVAFWVLGGVIVLAFLALGAVGIGWLVFRQMGSSAQKASPTAAQVGQVSDTSVPIAVSADTATPAPASSTPAPTAATATATMEATLPPAASDTPQPKPLGMGKLLAFVSDRGDGKTLQIWTMKVSMSDTGTISAGEFTQVTFDEGDKAQPAWSPDGTGLLYTAPGPDQNGLDVFWLDLSQAGLEAVDVSDLPGDDTDPAWSPDGKRVAYTNTGRFVAGISSVYISDPDGKNRMRLSTDFQEFDAFWTPDDAWLMTVIFARDHHYLFRHPGDSLGTATPSPYDPSDYFGRLGEVDDPAISLDGKTIAYTRVKGNERSIFSVDTISRGEQISSLTEGKTTEYQPTWSPDGLYLAFTSERDGNREIYIMTSTGLLQTNLSQSPGVDWQAAWQP